LQGKRIGERIKLMIQIDLFQAVYIIATAVLGAVIWFVRLEGRVKYNEMFNKETQKDVDVLRNKYEALDSKILEKLAEISERLARIEGYNKRGEEDAKGN
jgi:uncharacterized lipoprotein YmbA